MKPLIQKSKELTELLDPLDLQKQSYINSQNIINIYSEEIYKYIKSENNVKKEKEPVSTKIPNISLYKETDNIRQMFIERKTLKEITTILNIKESYIKDLATQFAYEEYNTGKTIEECCSKFQISRYQYNYYLKKQKYSNHMTKWTNDEDFCLLNEIVKNKMSFEDIAKKHKRTPYAIKLRVVRLMLKKIEKEKISLDNALEMFCLSIHDYEKYVKIINRKNK